MFMDSNTQPFLSPQVAGYVMDAIITQLTALPHDESGRPTTDASAQAARLGRLYGFIASGHMAGLRTNAAEGGRVLTVFSIEDRGTDSTTTPPTVRLSLVSEKWLFGDDDTLTPIEKPRT